MSQLHALYRANLAMLTDLYQLTMACAYWRSGQADTEAIFNLSFRKQPFQGGFTVACGLSDAMALMQDLHFEASDLAYLATLTGADDTPLFDAGFLDYLSTLKFSCDVDAIPEGTVVFPHEPLLRVQGPIIQCQLLETALLTVINFQTLIATKAARVTLAAGDDPVLEFGLRRAQGIDGGVSASRAAYVGGVAATSNVLAGKLHAIPVRGTHAHSWVMCFDEELEAFEQYAGAMPHNSVLLVDTYDTIQGIRHAITVGHQLVARGHRLGGIRLDSGDLAYLSVRARAMLDEAGFHDAVVVASNDLDEHVITSLKRQGAAIGVWGVGTRLATAFDQPALGGVYKLSAIRKPGQPWQDRIKLSEQAIKVSTPGVLQVRRYTRADGFVADMIYDSRHPPDQDALMIDPLDMTRRRHVGPARGELGEDLLVPIFRAGAPVYHEPPLSQTRERARQQLATFHSSIKRFEHPHQYPVGLEHSLHEHKTALILKARGFEA